MVKNGFCRGIGYLNEAQSLRNIEEIEEILEVFKPSVVSNSIIRNHIKTIQKLNVITSPLKINFTSVSQKKSFYFLQNHWSPKVYVFLH